MANLRMCVPRPRKVAIVDPETMKATWRAELFENNPWYDEVKQVACEWRICRQQHLALTVMNIKPDEFNSEADRVRQRRVVAEEDPTDTL